MQQAEKTQSRVWVGSLLCWKSFGCYDTARRVTFGVGILGVWLCSAAEESHLGCPESRPQGPADFWALKSRVRKLNVSKLPPALPEKGAPLQLPLGWNLSSDGTHTLCAGVLVLENTWVSRVLGSESFYQPESLPRVVQLEEEEDKGGGGRRRRTQTYKARRLFYLDSTMTHANLKIEFIACCFIREEFNLLYIYHGCYSVNFLARKQQDFAPGYEMPHVLMLLQHATVPPKASSTTLSYIS